jgi:hypothetical protein
MTTKPAEVQAYEDKKLAAVRLWALWVGHAAFAPASSLYYSAKTSYWTPFVMGTALGIFGLPLMILDFGLTAFIIAPVASAVAMQAKVKEKRRALNVNFPEEVEG